MPAPLTRIGGADVINRARLALLPLPPLDERGDKESRGRVLVVGGSREMAGAVALAGVGALRAGAGKLQLATVERAAVALGVAVPEARVFALKETASGGCDVRGFAGLVEHLRSSRAVVVGPGMIEDAALATFVARVAQSIDAAALVLDANALNALERAPDLLEGLGGGAILTPHATELSEMTGEPEEEIASDPRGAALRAAEKFGAVVALKGRETFVASPGGKVYVNRAGNVGLATSGSGDVLAGVIAGLAARGADSLTAAVWGGHAHALAGERLARRVGRVGYLARELLDEIPSVLDELVG
ncbi:MAG: NAD(P)H-hydrate dehydratase [Pyrinomonadaceae bacterium]